MLKFFKILILVLISIFYLNSQISANEKKLKIGLLIPISGENKKIGQQIIKSTRMALKDIGENKVEVYLKDTNSNPNQTIKSANELQNMGIQIVIGPVFFKNLI